MSEFEGPFGPSTIGLGLFTTHYDDDEFKEAIAEVVNEVLDERAGRDGPKAPSPWMTLAEASAYLRCPASYIYDGRTNGRFTPHKRGNRVLLDRAEIEAHARGERFPARRNDRGRG